ncbi:MAG: hypothetical protein ABJC12_05430 [Saprospiraceae bacterium]
MKQNLLITSFIMVLISFVVFPLQAKQVDGIWGHHYNTKEQPPSKFETSKNDRLSYHGKHALTHRHHKKGHRFERKFNRSAGVNGSSGFQHNTGNKFRNHSQRDGVIQNSNAGRWDGFQRNQSERRSGDFHGKGYSKHDRKNKMFRHHDIRNHKSNGNHRNRRSEQQEYRN